MPCKNCNQADIPTPEDLERIAAELALSVGRERDLCANEERNGRLLACSACEALAFGVLCRHCGCFVQLRSLMQENVCPHPAKNRWSDRPVLY